MQKGIEKLDKSVFENFGFFAKRGVYHNIFWN